VQPPYGLWSSNPLTFLVGAVPRLLPPRWRSLSLSHQLTPARVNARYLSEHRGQTVRLPAKIVKLVGDTATVEASDGGEVSCLS
jgi:hypothetical protein